MNDPNDQIQAPIGSGQALYNPAELAALLQISQSAVYDFARRGILPSVRIGRAVRFRPDAIDRWLAERETEGQPSVPEFAIPFR